MQDERKAYFIAPAWRRSPVLWLFLLSLLLWPNPLFAKDSSSPVPQRIISLSPSVTEILYALGAGNKLVGVTDYCKYPKAATLLPSVGGFMNPSYERMISLRPDLIIHQEDNPAIVKFARQIRVQSFAVSMLTLAKIFATIQSVGELVHRPQAAEDLILEIQNKIDTYRKKLQPLQRKSVFLLLGVGNDPAQTLYGVGRNTFLGELLELAGGDNILPDSLSPYPKVSKEFVIRQSPEVVIEIGPVANQDREAMNNKKRVWEMFPTIQAVRSNSIYYFSGDYLLIPGPRLTQIIDHFAHALHPKIFPGDGKNLKVQEVTP